ncbi:MAG TPA: hypothetical protein VF498_16600, partial [Anaerolineales bacterium]
PAPVAVPVESPAPTAANEPEPLPLAATAAEPDPAHRSVAGAPPAPVAPLQTEAPAPLGPAERSVAIPAYLVSPAPALEEESGAVRMITIVLRSTGDKTRDVLRLRRIYGMITSYPGNDRFGFHVFERGRGYLLEFPNSTAGYCQDLMQRLTALVGVDNVRVELITFQ